MTARFCGRCGKLTGAGLTCLRCQAVIAAAELEGERRQRRILRGFVRRGLVPKRVLREVFG